MPGGYSGLYPSLNGQKPPKTFEEKVIEWGGMNPVECLDEAYRAIRHRKGSTKEGTFVKEQ